MSIVMRPFGPVERAIFDALADNTFAETFITTTDLDRLTIIIADAIKLADKPQFKHFLKGKPRKRAARSARNHIAM